MQNPDRFDVIIIGAGMVGSYSAHALAKMGYSVCVLEKNPETGYKSSCTGIVSKDCIDLLPFSKSAVQFEVSSARIFSPSGNPIRIERSSAQAFVMDRPSLDGAMSLKAAKNGACLQFSTLALSIRVNDQFAEVHARCHNEPLVLQSSIVLIASGAGTTLTKDMGLGQIHEYAQGAQAEVTCKDLQEVEIYTGTNLAPGFFSWLVPAGKSHAKAGLLTRGNPAPYIASFIGRLEQQGRISGGKHEVKYGIVPLKPLGKTYGERIMVVGDAAGQVKPTTGGGIYFGLLCADTAVKNIHESLSSSDQSARFLSLYQKKWHKLLKQELSIDYWAHRFYRSLDDKQIEHIFSVIKRHGIHESILASPDITFDWHGKVILDALKHRSLQRSLEKLGMPASPTIAGRKAYPQKG